MLTSKLIMITAETERWLGLVLVQNGTVVFIVMMLIVRNLFALASDGPVAF